MSLFAARWATSYVAAAQWALPGAKPGMNFILPSGTISEQQDAPLLARVYTKDNTALQQADVYQILLRVYDKSGTEVYGEEVSAGSSVFDSLQTGDVWTAGATGYNLSVTFPGRGVFLAGGASYTAEVTIELNDDDAITITGNLRVRPTRTYEKTA